MATNQFIGRRVKVGFGKETTPGTAVAPTDGMKHMKLSFFPVVNKIQNESAMGRVEKINGSDVASHWVEGPIEGKVGDVTIGYLLYGGFGACVTSDNADSNAAVKDHTFDVAQTNNRQTFTVTTSDPIATKRHALGTISEVEISGETDGYIMANGTMYAKTGVDSADTIAVTVENEFVAKHVTAKLAANVAGIGAASAIDILSFKLKLGSAIKPHTGMSAEPKNFLAEPWEASGEMVIQYTSEAYHDLWFDNTIQALQIAIENTDVTIGAAAHPKLTFTAPQATLNTWSRSDDLDAVVEQTVGFYCELSASDGYALRAVLTNTKASY